METEEIWLIDESPTQAETEAAVEREVGRRTRSAGLTPAPDLAIRFKDIVVHDNKRWFGESDIRFDAVVLHGNAEPEDPTSFYTPATFRFGRVADGDTLPSAQLMVFRGRPRHFLDMFVTVSRDTKDSDDLADLLGTALKSDELKGSASAVLGLAVAAPHVAAVMTALTAATTIGKVAYDVVRKATGSTIGLYHCSWLEQRDRFGLGRHPDAGEHRVKDLSFWFEVVEDVAPPST